MTLLECSLEATPAAPSDLVSERSGQAYLTLSADGKNVVRCDYKTGRLEAVVMSRAKLRDCDVKSWDGFILSPNEKLMLLYTGVEPVYRHAFKES